MEIATDVILRLAHTVWKKRVDSLSEDEVKELEKGELQVLSTIMNNPNILRGATSFLKKIIAAFDYNQDGEVSLDECARFWCCGNPNGCKKKKTSKK